jgi:hypothetical protein
MAYERVDDDRSSNALDAFDRVIVHPNARLRGFSVRFSASSAWILSRQQGESQI